MKKITLALLLLSCLPAMSQVTVISPTGDGGFETGATFAANGWTEVGPPANNNRRWYAGTGQAGFSGTRAAFIGNNATTVGTNSANRTVHLYRSITIPAGAENIVLTFKYKQAVSDFDGDIYDFVVVTTGTAAPVNGVLPAGDLHFGPFPETNVPAFTEQTALLPNAIAGTTTNLIFTFVADNIAPNGYGAVDDISLTYEMPSCPMPSNLVATTTSDVSAIVSWTPPTTAPAEGYEYYFTEGATVPDAGTTPSGTTSVPSATIEGLTPGAEVAIYVRANCGDGDYSSWAGPLNILTLCTAQNVPYTMGFETAEALECIRLENVNGATSWSLFTAGGNGTASGTNSVRYNWDGTAPADDWFFLKGLNLTGGQSYTLNFKYKSSNGPSLLENLEVKYGTSPIAADMTLGTIVTLAGINSAVADPFATSTNTFTPNATGTYYIGFHCYSIPDQAFLYIDDVAVDVLLATDDMNKTALRHYPNPVKDVLNLAYDQNITEVAVYNLLGQRVLLKQVNTTETQINMSELPSGNYIVKVKADALSETLKIVKQ